MYCFTEFSNLINQLLQNLLQPQVPFYTNLAKDCVKHGVGIDLFLFPNGYTDVATIGRLSSITGGSIYKYSHFKVSFRSFFVFISFINLKHIKQ